MSDPAPSQTVFDVNGKHPVFHEDAPVVKKTPRGFSLGYKYRKPSEKDVWLDLPEIEEADALPDAFNLVKEFPPVYQQGDLGSCTANATAAVLAFDLSRDKEGVLDLSRLFIYNTTRQYENTPLTDDSGAIIKDVFSNLKKVGVCLEADFPYIPSNYFIAPPSKAYKDALVHCKGASYKRIQQDPTVFQKSLYSAKRPIVLGIVLYSSFEAESTIDSGLVPMPDTENEEVLGGHCVAIVGYEMRDGKLYFLLRNSWGTEDPQTGERIGLADFAGHFLIPSDYLMNENLTSDMWCIQSFH